MNLKRNKYETLEYTEDDDKYSLVIGVITMQGDSMCSAEIICDYITNRDDLEQARAFLDEVEDVMDRCDSEYYTEDDVCDMVGDFEDFREYIYGLDDAILGGEYKKCYVDAYCNR